MRAERSGPARPGGEQDGSGRPAGNRTAAAAPVRPGRLSGPMLPALQRAAGNAAVARAIAQEQHVHEEGCGHQGPGGPSAVHEVLRGGGQPLDKGTRTDLAARPGADFSDVRVHTAAVAQRSAAETGARAYTSGRDVVIGAGGADRHTLAHELTHVIQQRGGPAAGADNGSGLRVSDPGDRFEQEAERHAHRASAGPAPAVQRAPDGNGHGRGPAGTHAPATAQRMITDAAAPQADGSAPERPLLPAHVTAMLTEYGQHTGSPEVRSLVDEVLPLIALTTFTGRGAVELPARPVTGPVAGERPGGGASTMRDPAHGGRYVVGGIHESHRQREDLVATLLHELVHVAVFERYGQDQNLPQGQSAEQTDTFRIYVMNTVVGLVGLLPGSGLPEAWREAAEQKLRFHMGVNAHLEYDGVLTQVLVWSDQYGDPGSPFHRRVSELAVEAQRWRQNPGEARTPEVTGTLEAAMTALLALPSRARNHARAAVPAAGSRGCSCCVM
ncbi:DUF4157 domain-containing protein [Kitasatospora indigofera]|uniref:eCIS core domain-containing protein n=1 Tax=Kitasatospora indigofera TaxID=67307 RepID=UPI00369D52A0